ncbi:ankyrin repeat domain-containing protein [Bordetella sp. 02P26C-1]|uniref:ankyrin repeat domain-containing protein n=1 Tax=Bordetella sp. 02P26C-1 TaxID=2683195 RepID=UPI00135541B3|nr:ankyrin repeat domain-containing protein [Bordetella sp. 02P26C-1]MVW77416.1 hypothetical protein [Bordetella sp. 02P26C-1]
MRPVSPCASPFVPAVTPGSVREDTPPDPGALKALEKALASDDVAAFWELSGPLFAESANGLFDNGENILHVAVRRGCRAIALDIAHRNHQWGFDLVNTRNDEGRTPLEHAVAGLRDDPDLVQALLETGVHGRLEDALCAAAQNGHVLAAKRLVEAGANPTSAMVDFLHFDSHPGGRAEGLAMLRSLGANLSDGLSLAARMAHTNAVRALHLLGASGSALILARFKNGTCTVQELSTLVMGGADVQTVLRELVHADALEDAHRLIAVDTRVNGRLSDPTSPAAVATLLQLIELNDEVGISRLLKLLEGQISDTTLWAKLLICGDVVTLRRLYQAGLKQPNNSVLRSLLAEGRVTALTTLMEAGMAPCTLLKNLGPAWRKDRDAIATLLAAYVPPHQLSEGDPSVAKIINALRERKFEVDQLPDQARRKVIADTCEEGKPGEAAWLLKSYRALTDLRRILMTHRGAGTTKLLETGLGSPHEMIGEIMTGWRHGVLDKATLYGLVVPMRESGLWGIDPLTPYIFDFVKNGDLKRAEQMFSSVSKGTGALAEAAQRNDLSLANLLLHLGAEGGGATIKQLLRDNKAEVAGRLLAAGVNIHDALGDLSDSDGRLLEAIGADWPMGLLRAAQHLQDTRAFRLILKKPGILLEALLHLAHDHETPVDFKAAQVAFLTQTALRYSTIRVSSVINPLAEDTANDAKLRALINLGIPTEDALMTLARDGNRLAAQRMILAGADFIGAMRSLHENGENDARSTLGLALTVVRDKLATKRLAKAKGSTNATI